MLVTVSAACMPLWVRASVHTDGNLVGNADGLRDGLKLGNAEGNGDGNGVGDRDGLLLI